MGGPWLAALVALEIALAPLTIRAFGREAKIKRDEHGRIRDAVAQFEAAALIPALARLVDAIEALRRPPEQLDNLVRRPDLAGKLTELRNAAREPGLEALRRALADVLTSVDRLRGGERADDALARGDVSTELTAVVRAAEQTASPRTAEAQLIRRWKLLGWALVAVHILAVAFFYGLISGSALPLPGGDVLARILFGAAVAAALIALELVRRADLALAEVIRQAQRLADQARGGTGIRYAEA